MAALIQQDTEEIDCIGNGQIVQLVEGTKLAKTLRCIVLQIILCVEMTCLNPPSHARLQPHQLSQSPSYIYSVDFGMLSHACGNPVPAGFP